MSSIPVLKSKLTMPELTENFLLTERLQKLYEDMDKCRAVTVCAPAGYGKTTLALSYLNHHAARPCRICWYRLDPEDTSLQVFLAHLTEALFPSKAPAFESSRKVIKEQADLSPQQIISMICSELWENHNKAGDTRIYLVLDDFHNVAQSQEICSLTRYLLDSLPPYCTIILMNRANLAVFTEKQKLEKK
jgi:LuxR family maltose regulon positive regulatory protein